MACNCATTEQINELYRRYGSKRDRKNLTTKQKIKNAVLYTGVAISMIFITPVLFCYVIYKRFFTKDHKISMTKFFRLDKKVSYNVGQ